MTTSPTATVSVGRSLVPALLLAVGCFAAATAPAATPADSPGERAIWEKHEYTFQFLGFTSTYSCDGLADKIKLLLSAAGARKDSTVRSGGCAEGSGRPDKFARAYLTFFTLSPAAANGQTDAQAVTGVWRPVTITDRSPRELGTGDCELVEQFHHDVLGMFTTREVTSRTTCIPHQNSGSVIDLKFETLTTARSAKPR